MDGSDRKAMQSYNFVTIARANGIVSNAGVASGDIELSAAIIKIATPAANGL
jgi:hypothetical protein